MIDAFEEITRPMSEDEKKLVRPIIAGFYNHVGKENAIKGEEICRRISVKYQINFRDSRLRKIVNYLRNLGIPIIATSNGYYYSNDIEEIERQISSLEQRANAIESAKRGLILAKNKIMKKQGN